MNYSSIGNDISIISWDHRPWYIGEFVIVGTRASVCVTGWGS